MQKLIARWAMKRADQIALKYTGKKYNEMNSAQKKYITGMIEDEMWIK